MTDQQRRTDESQAGRPNRIGSETGRTAPDEETPRITTEDNMAGGIDPGVTGAGTAASGTAVTGGVGAGANPNDTDFGPAPGASMAERGAGGGQGPIDAQGVVRGQSRREGIVSSDAEDER